MTLNAGVLTVDAQTNGLSQTYDMTITMVTPDSGDQTFATVTVVLDLCVIVSLDPPTDPTSLAYTIFAVNKLTIDLASPGF